MSCSKTIAAAHDLTFLGLKPTTFGLSAYNQQATPYLVVDAIEVCIETLVIPPAGVGDLGTDVARVRCAEALLVVVPAERVLHCPAEARHMQTVLSGLILHTAKAQKKYGFLTSTTLTVRQRFEVVSVSRPDV